MLPPTITDDFLFLRRSKVPSTPPLLKPMRLISASSWGRRNRRGWGLPSCPFGVSVPISINPKPSKAISSMRSASLSNPAAKPTGLVNFNPNTSRARRGSSSRNAAPRTCFSNGRLNVQRISEKVKWWAASGCCKKRKGLMSCLYTGEFSLGLQVIGAN